MSSEISFFNKRVYSKAVLCTADCSYQGDRESFIASDICLVHVSTGACLGNCFEPADIVYLGGVGASRRYTVGRVPSFIFEYGSLVNNYYFYATTVEESIVVEQVLGIHPWHLDGNVNSLAGNTRVCPRHCFPGDQCAFSRAHRISDFYRQNYDFLSQINRNVQQNGQRF